MKLLSVACHITQLMSQHWFRQWLGAIRQLLCINTLIQPDFPGVHVLSTDTSHPRSGTVSSNIAKKGVVFIFSYLFYSFLFGLNSLNVVKKKFSIRHSQHCCHGMCARPWLTNLNHITLINSQ